IEGCSTGCKQNRVSVGPPRRLTRASLPEREALRFANDAEVHGQFQQIKIRGIPGDPPGEHNSLSVRRKSRVEIAEETLRWRGQLAHFAGFDGDQEQGERLLGRVPVGNYEPLATGVPRNPTPPPHPPPPPPHNLPHLYVHPHH